MEVIELEVNNRSGFGKSAQVKIRRDGKIPAVVYSSGEESTAFEVNELHFLRKTSGLPQGQIYSLKSEDGSITEELTLIKEVQVAALTQKIIHVDFYRLTKGTKIDVTIPIHLQGESVAVKNVGGIVNQILYEVEVKCLPKSIPSELTIDITTLDEGSSLHLSDIKLPDGVELNSDPKLSVVSVIVKKLQDEEPEVEAAAEEGAAPAEGEAAAADAGGDAKAASKEAPKKD